MQKLVLLLSLMMTLSAFSAEILTVSNRKTNEKLRIHCQENCTTIEFELIDTQGQSSILSTLTAAQLQTEFEQGLENDKARLKDNFFVITQAMTRLPWDNGEFVMTYLVLAPFTIPLTAAGVALDTALVPIGVVTYAVDLADGNLYKKLARKMKKKKDFRISNDRFRSLVKRFSRI